MELTARLGRKPDRDEAFDNIVHQRMERGSGARMLLDAADFFDIDQELAENLGKEVDEAIFCRKGANEGGYRPSPKGCRTRHALRFAPPTGRAHRLRWTW
ncbi:hypothetical protein [Mesorhizobium sp. Cs1321R2N1]|uniref:hypothetical protein n=1 Tax=Mesorhizobium sp. Cs1321R2N1 TaxID=3015174 RepID=UPI00301C8EFF